MAMPSAAAAMAATPERRRERELGPTGLTPAAKRVAARPELAAHSPVNLSLQKLTDAFLKLQKRYECDVPWSSAMAEATTDHAARLDIIRDLQRGLVDHCKGITDGLSQTRQELANNDADLKKAVAHNDAELRKLLDLNDGTVKEAVAKVDKQMKETMDHLERVRAEAAQEFQKRKRPAQGMETPRCSRCRSTSSGHSSWKSRTSPTQALGS